MERQHFYFDSYEDLAKFLRNWTSLVGPSEYDFGLAIHFFTPCIDNLVTNALDAELEDAAELFSEEQAAFIKKLAAMIEKSPK